MTPHKLRTRNLLLTIGNYELPEANCKGQEEATHDGHNSDQGKPEKHPENFFFCAFLFFIKIGFFLIFILFEIISRKEKIKTEKKLIKHKKKSVKEKKWLRVVVEAL